jgi:hypothetical protein
VTMLRAAGGLALALLTCCSAPDIAGPLTGRYAGSCTVLFGGRPDPDPGASPCALVVELRHTDSYVDGTTIQTLPTRTSNGRVYGTVDGVGITACAWSEGGSPDPCPASWTASVSGSGDAGTVLAGYSCNNSRAGVVCLEFRVVKQ